MFFLFGLLTGPQLFTKIQQTLVKYWVAKGFHIFTYLDDGAGANQIWDNVVEISALVRNDIVLSRFVPNEEKSQWVPTEIEEFLGFIMESQYGSFQVPARRVQALKQLMDTLIKKCFTVSASVF